MPRGKNKGGGARMDSLYSSDDFRMYCFKVLPCSKHYCHDWTECPFAHPGEKARRRDPRVFPYVGIECPQLKEQCGKCGRGDLCPFAHNVFECWLHPTRYRTQLCNEPASCRRKVCFFAHSVEELREPTTGMDNVMDSASAAAIANANFAKTKSAQPEAAAAAAAANSNHSHNAVKNGASSNVPKPDRRTPHPARPSLEERLVAEQRAMSRRTSVEGMVGSGARSRRSLDVGPMAHGRRGNRMSADLPPSDRVRGAKPSGRHSLDVRSSRAKETVRVSAAQLQALQNELQSQQLSVPSFDLRTALDQMSLDASSQNQMLQNSQILQLVQQLRTDAQGVAQNDRAMQLIMLLLKELLNGNGGQAPRSSLDINCGPRTSFESTFSVGSNQVPAYQPRVSLDSLTSLQAWNMLANSTAQASAALPDCGMYVPQATSRVSMDAGVPDFILHDCHSRPTSLDSAVSENFVSYNRISTDSGYESSVVSGPSDMRRMSVDSTAPSLRLGGMIGDVFPASKLAEFLTGKVEIPASMGVNVGQGGEGLSTPLPSLPDLGPHGFSVNG